MRGTGRKCETGELGQGKEACEGLLKGSWEVFDYYWLVIWWNDVAIVSTILCTDKFVSRHSNIFCIVYSNFYCVFYLLVWIHVLTRVGYTVSHIDKSRIFCCSQQFLLWKSYCLLEFVEELLQFFCQSKGFRIWLCMTAASRMVDHFLSKTPEVAQMSKPPPKPPLNTSKSTLHSVTHARFLLSLSLSLQCPFPLPLDLTQTHTVFF